MGTTLPYTKAGVRTVILYYHKFWGNADPKLVGEPLGCLVHPLVACLMQLLAHGIFSGHDEVCPPCTFFCSMSRGRLPLRAVVGYVFD